MSDNEYKLDVFDERWKLYFSGIEDINKGIDKLTSVWEYDYLQDLQPEFREMLKEDIEWEFKKLKNNWYHRYRIYDDEKFKENAMDDYVRLKKLINTRRALWTTTL